MGVPCQVPAIAPVTGRLDYAQDEAALLFRFAHARRAAQATRRVSLSATTGGHRQS
jgi:hypothetical protein